MVVVWVPGLLLAAFAGVPALRVLGFALMVVGFGVQLYGVLRLPDA